MGEEQSIAVLQVSELQTNDAGGHGTDDTISHVLLVIHADEKIHIIRMSKTYIDDLCTEPGNTTYA